MTDPNHTRRQELTASSISLWRSQPQPIAVDARQTDRRRRCARCNQRIDGRPLPRQLAALSLLKLPLCRDCYLDIEESASSFGETGRAFEDRLFGKLAQLAEQLS